jgi:hypothetical protein
MKVYGSEFGGALNFYNNLDSKQYKVLKIGEGTII